MLRKIKFIRCKKIIIEGHKLNSVGIESLKGLNCLTSLSLCNALFNLGSIRALGGSIMQAIFEHLKQLT